MRSRSFILLSLLVFAGGLGVTAISEAHTPKKTEIVSTPKQQEVVYETYSQLQTEFSYDRFLNAIAEIETGNDPSAIGQAGERSAYQFMESTWYDRTDTPFVLATKDPDLAREVAIKHTRWVRDRVKSIRNEAFNDDYKLFPQELDQLVYDMAIIWNYGYGNFLNYVRKGENLPQSVENYAQRVVTLYREKTDDVASNEGK